MDITTYFILKQIICGVMLFFGLCMFFEPVPQRLKGRSFGRSIRVMGVALMLLPISSFIYFFCHMIDYEQYIATAINLTTFFAISVLLTIAFLILINDNIPFKSYRFRIPIIACFIYPIALWSAILYGDVRMVETLIVASYTILLFSAISEVALFIHRYKIKKHRDSLTMSIDEKIQMQWVAKAVWLVVGLAMVSILSPFVFTYPLWFGLVFMLYGLATYLYIFVGFHRMMIAIIQAEGTEVADPVYEITDEAIEVAEYSSPQSLNAETARHIEHNLKKWVEKRSFTKNSISIQSVANELYTNRTYLSLFINSVYGCSFKVWVTALRIEEAKNELRSSKKCSIVEIADRTGFSSATSFIHVFRRSEGIAPAKWRLKYREADAEL